MFKNYLKIAFRNLMANKTYSLITILGLSIGLAAVMVMGLYIQFETSYDDFYKQGDQIFRLTNSYLDPDVNKEEYSVTVPYSLAPQQLTAFPEIESAVRIYKNPTDQDKIMIQKGNDYQYESELFVADPPVFSLFDWPLLQGNPQTALAEPLSVVMTLKSAQKYFGDDDPFNKILSIKRGNNTYHLKVTGIMQELPVNSHIHPEIICSSLVLGSPMIENGFGERVAVGYTNQWPLASSSLYLKLIPNANTQQIAQKIINQIPNQRIIEQQQYYLQSIQDIYLHSNHFINDMAQHGSLENIQSFSIIAFLILSVACINFVILSTARSATRAKEIGIRKVVGASRRQLIKQLLCESILITLVSLPVAIFLAEFSIPTWNSLMGSHLVIHPINAVLFVSITIVVGILSGIYIAFIISSFHPVDIFSGKLFHGRLKTLFRKVLIGMQLSIFIGLCTLSIFVFQQMRYIQSNRTLGYDKDYLLLIDLPDKSTAGHYQTFKNAILSNHSILSVSASSSKLPNEPSKSWLMGTNKERTEVTYARFCMNYVDYDYLETIGIQLIAGRSFSKEISSDFQNTVILNETALKAYGGLELVGQRLKSIGVWNCTLIGVVQDYHVESLYDDIWPVCFRLDPDYIQQIVVRISADNVAGTIDFLQKEWKEAVPQYPFEYQFSDDAVNQIYRAEQNIGKLIAASTLLTIFIACLGIFGLSVYLIARRTKEIGLRKILGASIAGIVSMLTKDFVKWTVFSNIIAWPLAYYAVNRWLQNFAYRIEMTVWPFLFAGLAALGITFFTVSWQAIRAATVNPVKSLRYE